MMTARRDSTAQLRLIGQNMRCCMGPTTELPMMLDHDLVRELLLGVQSALPNREAGEIRVKLWTRDTILEHIEALDEAGLLTFPPI